MRRLVALLLAFVAMLALPLSAQNTGEDGTFLETWLETNLSAAGREVRVSGFTGALSSQATIDEITIADDEGVWFTLRGAVLDWTRSALLTGRLEIDSLSAETIEISRRPVSISDGPQAETSDFALPELPVSINIGRILAKQVVLGAPILGVAAELSLDGSGRLEAGAGNATLALERIDGPEGVLSFEGSYSNETQLLALGLRLKEGPKGIVAGLIGLPDDPAMGLDVSGEGLISAFTADIALVTDGQARLAGQVALAAAENPDGEETPSNFGFRATLAGDPSALFLPEYGAFFGPDTRLSLEGQRDQTGRVDIPVFAVDTRALALAGSLVLNPLGWPEQIRLSGRIAAPAGDPVLLPVGGEQTRITHAALRLDYDAQRGDVWLGSVSLENLARPELAIGTAQITGNGTLTPGGEGETPRVSGRLGFTAAGIASPNAEFTQAIGESLTGQLDFTKQADTPFAIDRLVFAGEDYGVSGSATLAANWEQLDLLASGDIELSAQRLSRFAGLTGRPVTGAASLSLVGAAAWPNGSFDIEIGGTGQDLGIGEVRIDRLFVGESTLSITAERDETGIRIEHFEIAASSASARANAVLKSGDSRIEARIEVADAGVLADGLSGAAVIAGFARQTGTDWSVELDATAPGQTEAKIAGTFTMERGKIGPVVGGLRISTQDLAPYSGLAGRRLSGDVTLSANGEADPRNGTFVATGSARGTDFGMGLGDFDKLFTGPSSAGFTLRRDGEGRLFIDQFNLETPEITATATAISEAGQPKIEMQARLRDLNVIVPGFAGAFSGNGQAALSDTGWQVSGEGVGPGGTEIRISGRIAADGQRADIALDGRAPLGFANSFIAPRRISGMVEFDLDLTGPIALNSLSGTARTQNANLSLPTLRMAFNPITASMRISGGRGFVDASTAVASGGRIAVSGPVSLFAPHSADLAIQLDAVGLNDPTLYDASADGALSIVGPLAGGALVSGAISFGTVNLSVPETGFGIDGGLPGLGHIAEPSAVRVTRSRAGLIGQDSGAAGRGNAFLLDIVISAPARVFLRGRGLDAEFGGVLRLGGTTADIIAQGGFQLIRGRLDILGKRLTLTEGVVTMRGSLDPRLRLVAETPAQDILVRIIVDGHASEPSIRFTSSPTLPEEEILARLLFGRGLDKISPIQALKLASAVATLSGKGGSGVIDRLREGFGLDDLDVVSDAEGNIAVRAGAYISENIYTDVTVGADGKAEINLNLSITPDISLTGRLSQDGNTGVGIYFEKDY